EVVEAAEPNPPTPGDWRGTGKVYFKVSCTAAAQAEFNRGVALLHSFFYEEARRAFTAVAEQDPNSAIAEGGIATSWWHRIWRPPRPDEMVAGKNAIDRAVKIKGKDDREGGFINALNVYYNTPDGAAASAAGQSCHGPVGPRDRVVAYEKEMRNLYDK